MIIGLKRLCAIILLLTGSQLALAEPTDYLVLEWSAADGVRPLFHQVVDISRTPRPKGSTVVNGLHAAVRDRAGNPLQYIRLDTIGRAEFAGSGHVDGHHFKRDRSVFVVRAQAGSGASVAIVDNAQKVSSTWQIADLAASAETRAGVAKYNRGLAMENRVNLLFTGDGYTAAEQDKFNADLDIVIDGFLSVEPYASYRDFVTTRRLFVASSESGADHPSDPCGDGAADPLAPLLVDTAFDASFCSFGVLRNLSVNNAKVFAAAAAVPDWDIVVAIVNDDTYGGSGGPVPVASTNGFATDILVHEYGHNFAGLADEYEFAFPAFPDCSDFGGGPACEPNVTDEIQRGSIKWSQLIDPATPVPTPESGPFASEIGLFDGARYQTAGKYRSELDCNMRTLSVPFCQVCRESYVFTLYEGSWGATNADGLSLIEPGSESPASFSLNGAANVPMVFSIQTLEPTHGLDVTWFVNDSPLPTTATELDFTPTVQGVLQVSVEVNDRAAIVDPESIDLLPTFSRTWTVNVGAGTDLIMLSTFELPDS